MKKAVPIRPKALPGLRARAQAALRAGKALRHPLPADARRLLHELQIHQVELQMQNEELRQAQVELAQARDRFSDLYDFAPVGYMTLDARGIIREANLTAASMLGLPRKDLLNKPFSRFLPRTAQDAFYLHCRTVFETAPSAECELAVRGANYTTFQARLVSVRFHTPPQPAACLTALFDVTPLYLALQALQEMTAQLEQRVAERTREVRQFSTLVHAAQDAIYTWSPDGRIEFWNGGAEKLFGYKAAEVAGRSVEMLLPLEQRAAWEQRCQRLLRGDAPDTYDTQRLHKSGQLVQISTTESVIHDTDGSAMALAAISRDITAQKEAQARREAYERQLRLLSHQILQAEENERRNLATVLHDGLAQQLTLLSLKLDTLAHAPGQAQRHRQLQEMRTLLAQAARAAHDLTFELFPPILHQLGLQPALRWAADEVRRHHGLKVSIQCRGRLERIPRDAQLIAFRCVRELLANVAKHAGARRAQVRLAVRGEALAIEVADDGRGFAPDHQAPRAAASPAGGFGLFSIRERLEHLGGSFAVASSAGKGSTIRLAIPIHRDANHFAQGSPP